MNILPIDFLPHIYYNVLGGGDMPRTGRPKTENPKIVKYSIRLDEETEHKLKEYCVSHRITRGEAIRRGVHLLLMEGKNDLSL